MSDEETEENGTIEQRPKRKEVDLNITIGKKEDAEIGKYTKEQLAQRLTQIGVPTEAEDIKSAEDFRQHVRILQMEVQKQKKSEEKAQSQTSIPQASGQSKLSGEQATDTFEPSEAYPSYGDIPIALREYPSRKAMLEDLQKEAENPNSEHQKEAQHFLTALGKKIQKSREPLEIELQNVRDVARGKKPVWKTKREDEY